MVWGPDMGIISTLFDERVASGDLAPGDYTDFRNGYADRGRYGANGERASPRNNAAYASGVEARQEFDAAEAKACNGNALLAGA